MDEQWRIACYDPEWRSLFLSIGMPLREALDGIAVRIDHVGSTSIAGMEAKPIIDIQISVDALEDAERYRTRIESLGFRYRPENTDKTKRYFREAPGSRRTHIHVREAGSFAEQATLLFRDYLRAHPEDCRQYAAEKHRLMARYKHDRPMYAEGKGPIVWEIMQRASSWSQSVGWRPGQTDV